MARGWRTKGGLTVADLSTIECRQPAPTHLGSSLLLGSFARLGRVPRAGEVPMSLNGSVGEVTAFGRSSAGAEDPALPKQHI